MDAFSSTKCFTDIEVARFLRDNWEKRALNLGHGATSAAIYLPVQIKGHHFTDFKIRMFRDLKLRVTHKMNLFITPLTTNYMLTTYFSTSHRCGSLGQKPFLNVCLSWESLCEKVWGSSAWCVWGPICISWTCPSKLIGVTNRWLDEPQPCMVIQGCGLYGMTPDRVNTRSGVIAEGLVKMQMNDDPVMCLSI